jgi:integrase
MSIKVRSKKLSDGSESIYLDKYYKGTREYESLDIKIKKNDPERKQKKELAERIRSKRESQLYSTFYDIPNLSNGNDDFLEYYNSNCKDSNYKASLNKLKEFTKEKMNSKTLPFNKVTEKLCEDYREWLLKNIGNNTAWVYVIKLKTILYKAAREKIIPINPAKYVSVKFQEPQKEYLTEEELRRLVKTETKHTLYRNAFLFACFTGLRISDIKALTWGQIRNGKLFFRQKKTKGMEYLPLSDYAIKILKEMNSINHYNPDDKVFDIEKKKTERIGTKIREWASDAGIDKYITFHTARHTFATLSLSRGVDIYTVSKLLGHKSIKMTEIYANIINENADKAVKMLPNF